MRNATVVLALMLLTPIADAGTVTINRPHIVYSSEEAVAAACKSPKRACTIIEMEFYCGCALSQSGWVVAPHMIATPSIYLSSDALLRHEHEHIVDIHKSLDEYAAALMMNSFPSEESCRLFVGTEAEAFTRTMKSIQRATTIKRDGVQFAGPH